LLIKQGKESRLFEMMIGGKRVSQLLPLHDDEGGAIRERPLLVRAADIQLVCLVERSLISGQYPIARILLKRGEGLHIEMAIAPVTEVVGQLEENPMTGDNRAINAIGLARFFVVLPIVGIEQCEEKERVGETGRHEPARSLR